MSAGGASHGQAADDERLDVGGVDVEPATSALASVRAATDPTVRGGVGCLASVAAMIGAQAVLGAIRRACASRLPKPS